MFKMVISFVQTLSNHNIQSPEVTSKAAPEDELDDSVKTLSEKFSEAILNIDAKEDLIKQHAKVAEEAVSGISVYVSFYDIFYLFGRFRFIFFRALFVEIILILPFYMFGWLVTRETNNLCYMFFYYF